MNSSAATAVCAACGSTGTGRYCAECGCLRTVGPLTIKAWLLETLDDLVSINGKLPSTLRALIRPGTLTLRWMEGARNAYLSPVKVYLLCSFAAVLLMSNIDPLGYRFERPIPPAVLAETLRLHPDLAVQHDYLGDYRQNLIRRSTLLIVLASLPSLALLFRLMFRRKATSIEHVVHSTHIHAVLSLVLAAWWLLLYLPSFMWVVNATAAVVLLVAIYLTLSISRVYQTSRRDAGIAAAVIVLASYVLVATPAAAWIRQQLDKAGDAEREFGRTLSAQAAVTSVEAEWEQHAQRPGRIGLRIDEHRALPERVDRAWTEHLSTLYLAQGDTAAALSIESHRFNGFGLSADAAIRERLFISREAMETALGVAFRGALACEYLHQRSDRAQAARYCGDFLCSLGEVDRQSALLNVARPAILDGAARWAARRGYATRCAEA